MNPNHSLQQIYHSCYIICRYYHYVKELCGQLSVCELSRRIGMIELAQVVVLLAYIQDVRGSILGQET
jgi:hypothetical protein